MDFLSERVSVDRKDGRTSVVISARTTRGRQTLLLTWVLAWIACGVLVILELNKRGASDPIRQYLLAFLAFWGYFAVVGIRALLWRLKGFELWRIKDGVLTIKDSLFGYGKATNYFVDNIQGIGLLQLDTTSFKYQWNQSVWVIGGERLGFDHMGKKVVFGKDLSEDEARRLIPLLKNALKTERTKG